MIQTPPPAMHPDFPINIKVRVKSETLDDPGAVITGTIVGIAGAHIFYSYIILLDEGVILPGKETWRAVAIPGQMLEEIK